MRKVIISAAAMTAFAALLASAPANAVEIMGRNRWEVSASHLLTRKGAISPLAVGAHCPQPASVAVAPKGHKARQK